MKRTYSSLLVSATIALLFAPSQASAQAPSLGTAASFGVLAGSTVTNTGPTTVRGDLGVSPGTAVTGFPPGTVTGGTIHSNDAVAQQAQSDVTVAYNGLAGLPCNTVLTGQDLGGLTLVAGVYCFPSSAQLTGTLTLDAQGNPNAQFIFQIGSTLTTASNSVVRVINGGNNCNVYWQVGSFATIGAATAFVGNILALTSITMTTGANVAGRLLARNGAVTLDSNSAAVCPTCNPITLSPSTLPNGTIGTAYNQTITASGGTAPYTFTVVAGSLPTGLTLAASGALSGTPTTAGSFTFTVRATDAGGCFGSRVYMIVINAAACPTITLSPSSIPAATGGTPYGPVTITASGGTAPYAFTVTVGALPPGLTLSPAGVISGTPTQSGSFTFTITATDAAGCGGSQIYTALVNCPAITVAPATLPNGTVGAAYNQAITASGGTAPYSFTVVSGSLPPGLTHSAAGALSGTPSTTGSSTFTIRATDAGGCLGERIYTLIVNAPAPTTSLACQAAFTAGTTANGTVTISSAQGTAMTITLSSSNMGVATVPANVVIPAGATSATFNITGVSQGTSTITATPPAGLGTAQTCTATVTAPVTTSITPPTPPPAGFSPGTTATATVTISAPRGVDTRIDLSSNAPGVVTVPGFVVIPAGATSATFNITFVGSGNATITFTPPAGVGAIPPFNIAVAQAANIPALGPFGLLLLVSLLALAGYFVTKTMS